MKLKAKFLVNSQQIKMIKFLANEKNVDDLALDVQQNVLQKEFGNAASEITVNPLDYFSPTSS